MINFDTHQPWFSLHCKCWACLIHLLMHVNALLLHQYLMYLIFFNILKFVCVWPLEIMVTIMLQLSTKVWVLHITSSLCWFDKSEVSIDKCRLNLATNDPHMPWWWLVWPLGECLLPSHLIFFVSIELMCGF